MPTTTCKDCTVLNKANKKIADLKEDIRRLSDELKKKDSLLSSFMEVASEQSKQITSLNATICFIREPMDVLFQVSNLFICFVKDCPSLAGPPWGNTGD